MEIPILLLTRHSTANSTSATTGVFQRHRLTADELHRMRPWRSEAMNAVSGKCPDITDLKPSDRQAFFESLNSPPSPTEALRAAFRRQKEALWSRAPTRHSSTDTRHLFPSIDFDISALPWEHSAAWPDRWAGCEPDRNGGTGLAGARLFNAVPPSGTAQGADPVSVL